MDRSSSQWIDATLRDAREDWKICYFHHPLYSNASRHGSSVDLRVLLEPIFVKHGVNVVFSGHDHVYERIKPQKGIYYFVSGAAGQLRQGQHGPIGADRGVLRSGPELHAGRDRRRGHVLPGDLAHRQDRRFRCRSDRQPDRADGGDAADDVVTTFATSRDAAASGHAEDRAARGVRGLRAAVPRLSQFAVEHLLLLPLGALDRAGVGQHGARELLPLHAMRSRSPSTTWRWCSSSR